MKINRKVRNMIKRASKDLEVERSRRIGKEHENLISKFFKTHEVDEPTRNIFERIPKYVSHSPTSLVLNARDENENLVAFDIVELASKDFAFYQFNLVSKEGYVPGASDLLFNEIVKIARDEGKKIHQHGFGNQRRS